MSHEKLLIFRFACTGLNMLFEIEHDVRERTDVSGGDGGETELGHPNT